MSGILMLVIAFFILVLAVAMKVVAKVSDSRLIFKLCVGGFLLLYILAAIAISYLNPALPRANVESFSDLLTPSPQATVSSETVPAAPNQDVIIRQ